MEKFYIVRHKHLRLTVPAHILIIIIIIIIIIIPIILLMKDWGPEELVNNYRIFNLEFSEQDFEEMIKYIVIEHRALKSSG